MSVEAGNKRWAPFELVRQRLHEGQPLSVGARQSIHPGAEVDSHAVELAVAPPAPWDPRAWPLSRQIPQLGLAFSQSVVDLYCAEYAGGPLDRTISGLSALDKYVALLAPIKGADPQARWVRRASVLIGAYLGEVLCDAVGARWREDEAQVRSPDSYKLFLGDGSTATPIQKAFDRLTGRSMSPLSEYIAKLADNVLGDH